MPLRALIPHMGRSGRNALLSGGALPGIGFPDNLSTLSGARLPDNLNILPGVRLPDMLGTLPGIRLPDRLSTLSGARLPDRLSTLPGVRFPDMLGILLIHRRESGLGMWYWFLSLSGGGGMFFRSVINMAGHRRRIGNCRWIKYILANGTDGIFYCQNIMDGFPVDGCILKEINKGIRNIIFGKRILFQQRGEAGVGRLHRPHDII